ncbi:MAG TPA: glutamate--cysteine ligase [Candidatus Bathyarchaeia archaeon]|nr:glutamate--cysteine ligase [Candidatus Bathyarchaeia archaeon]
MSDYIADDSGPDAEPIERFEQLLEHFERGAKPRASWRIGTEYEKVAVDARTGAAVPFSGPRGIEALLRGLADEFGWEPHDEEGRVIALKRGDGEITLEPGGQVELSGRQCETLHEAHAELQNHIDEIGRIGGRLGITFLGLGIQPFSTLDQIEWVPKKRYAIMAPYMAKVGSLGHRMMKQTATVQVNIDYESEPDAMAKMRVAMGIGPIINAIFANSPIVDGKATGFATYRSYIWTDTDNARCGMLPFVFHPRAGFADYIEWALDAPMYFIKRRGQYLDLTGIRFRDYWKNGHQGTRATVGDFALHLSTLFPEVRLKTYIELRMADSQRPELLLALSALAKGVFYTPDCLAAAWDLVKDWPLEERRRVQREAYRLALDVPLRRFRLGDLAKELLEIAEDGLKRQRCLDARGENETVYLAGARDHVRRGKAPGTIIAERWEGEWHREPARLIAHTAYGPPSEG